MGAALNILDNFSPMPKIVVAQNLGLSADDIQRLKELGEVVVFDDLAKSPEDWLKRCEGVDVICTGKFGLRDKIYDLQNVFIAVPFVGIGWIDKEKIKERHITVANAPGCNKDAVAEWIMYMMLNLFRRFPIFLNAKERQWGDLPDPTNGLTGRTVAILGKGNIGIRVGTICEAFDMKTRFFSRGDNLLEAVRNADIVIDCLSLNPSTRGLLNRAFFQSMKHGAFFITPTGKEIWDVDALLEALDQGILGGAATDAGNVQVGNIEDDFYQRLLHHPKMLVTPHIAYSTDVTNQVGGDIMISNVEAWLNGKPTNLY